MWKHYNLFYTRVLRSDLGLCFMIKNVHEIPKLNKIFLVSVSKEPLTIKNTLMFLSGLQLISNSKSRVILSRQSIPHMKIRKGQFLGAKVTLTGHNALQFLYFFVFNVLSQLDLFNLISQKKKKETLIFSLKSFIGFPRLNQHFNLFRTLSSFQILFSHKGKCENIPIFLRFLKFPIKIS